MNKNKIQDLLLKTMFILIPLTLLTLGVDYSLKKAADYIYQTYSAPFLAPGVTFTPHNTKNLVSTNVSVAPLVKNAKPHSK